MYIPSSERESQKKGGMKNQNDLAVLKTHFVCLQNLWGYCKPSTIRKVFQFTWQKLSFDIAICSHEQNTFTSILTTLSQGWGVSQSWCLHQNKEGIMRVEGIDNQKPYLDLLESFISSAETQACTFTSEQIVIIIFFKTTAGCCCPQYLSWGIAFWLWCLSFTTAGS